MRVESDPFQVFFDCQAFVEPASCDSRPLLLLKLVMYPLPVLHRHIQYRVHVLDEIGLYLLIDGCVMIEGGQVIYLEEPGLQLSVEHYIEAEQLVANVRLPRLRRLVVVLQLGLDCDDRLDYNVFDLSP